MTPKGIRAKERFGFFIDVKNEFSVDSVTSPCHSLITLVKERSSSLKHH